MSNYWQTFKAEWVNITSWWFLTNVLFIAAMTFLMHYLYPPAFSSSWQIVYGTTLAVLFYAMLALFGWVLLNLAYEKLSGKRSETTD